jgi:hypothetical protein
MDFANLICNFNDFAVPPFECTWKHENGGGVLDRVDSKHIMYLVQSIKELQTILNMMDKEWVLWSTVYGLLKMAQIDLRYSELQILDDYFEHDCIAIAVPTHEDGFYPSCVIWNAQNWIVKHLAGIIQHSDNNIMDEPKRGWTLQEYGETISEAIKVLLRFKEYVPYLSLDALCGFVARMSLCIEVLNGISFRVDRQFGENAKKGDFVIITG